MNKPMIKLCPPWVEYAEQVKTLFAEDPQVTVEYDAQALILTLRVDDSAKAEALARLMPPQILFGSVAVRICVVPANASGAKSIPDDAPTADLLLTAFRGNPVVTQVRQVSKGLFRNLCYCVCRKDVVQYPADNLADINGNRTLLMEDVARTVLERAEGVYFCTSAGFRLSASLDKPLGEWP